MYLNSAGPYLIPNIPLADGTAGVLEEIDIGATAADHGEMICVKACTIKRLMFILVGELAGGTTTAPTVVFKKRPTPLSATGETTLGTLTIPDATAIGKVVYKDITPVNLAVGDGIEIAHTVGVGTPTGKGFWAVELDDHPEDARNNTDMLASA